MEPTTTAEPTPKATRQRSAEAAARTHVTALCKMLGKPWDLAHATMAQRQQLHDRAKALLTDLSG